MMIRAVRNFVFHLYGIDKIKSLALVENHQDIVRIISGSSRRLGPIIWSFKTGDSVRANIVKVLNNKYVVIEERGLWSSRATLISVHEVASMMVTAERIF